MTQPTGSNEAPKEQMPWEMTWTEKAKQAITPAVDTVKKAVEGIRMPWEMDWKEKPRATPKPAPKAPVEPPTKGYKNEAAMKAAVQFTPEEEARRVAQESSPANIKELEQEIARTKDPKAKKVLQDYLNSLRKK